MKFVVACEREAPVTHPLRSQLTYEIVDDDALVAERFANADRGWFGELIEDDIAGPPTGEPGYAIVGPRTVTEYFELASVLAARGKANLAIRISRRQPPQDPAWPREARELRDDSVRDPDDDGVRLVFADALAGKRGSLVVVQCDLARDGMSPEESRSRRQAQRQLLGTYGKAWSRLGALTGLSATRCAFRRGFVEAVEIESSMLYGNAGVEAETLRLYDAAPHLQSITLANATFHTFFKLEEWSAWRRVTGLSVDAAFLAAIGGGLGHLRALAVRDATPQAAHALVGTLANLEILALPDHLLGPDAIAALVRSSPELRVLDVASDRGAPIDVIPASVRELHVATRAAATLPTGLEKLSLHGGELTALPHLRELRSLDIFDVRVACELDLPALRELRCSTLSADAARAIAVTFGEQLELLDLRGAAADHDLAELRDLVAGDVLVGTAGPRRPLLTASYVPYESLWDVGDVDLS